MGKVLIIRIIKLNSLPGQLGEFHENNLSTAKKKLSNLKTIKFINLNKKDVVRHKIVSEIISAYEK